MQQPNVKGFSQIAGLMNYKEVPYFSVKTLVYRSDSPNHVFYKLSFNEGYKKEKLIKNHKTRKGSAKN